MYEPPPYPGQPNPDVPSSVPPQPGLPPSAQPYPAQPGPGPGHPPPPPGRSRTLPIVLLSVAVALVLCVGGGFAVFLAARNTVNGIADRAEVTVSPTRTITLVEPGRLNGRPKLTDPQFARTADRLEADLGGMPGATTTVGAIYGTPGKRDVVVIAAVAAPVLDPQREVDGMFLGAGVTGLEVTGIRAVEPGPLGGAAKCGASDRSGLDLVMCGWADEGSVGWVIWYFRSVSQVRGEFARLRGQVEQVV